MKTSISLTCQTRVALPAEGLINEEESIRKQLALRRRNLLLLQEKMAQYVDPRNISVDDLESERIQQEEIAKLKNRLKNCMLIP